MEIGLQDYPSQLLWMFEYFKDSYEMINVTFNLYSILLFRRNPDCIIGGLQFHR